MENKEIIEIYKKEHMENIRNFIKETGGCETFIQLVGTMKGMDKPAIVHIAVDFEDDEEADVFIERGIPMLCKQIKEKELDLLCVTYNTEASMMAIDLKTEEKVETKKDVILVVFSQKDIEDTNIYEIEKQPYEVNEKGELEQNVNLKECEIRGEKINNIGGEVSGRFSNLYEKFAKHLK